jgi:hypothetical protein
VTVQETSAIERRGRDSEPRSRGTRGNVFETAARCSRATCCASSRSSTRRATGPRPPPHAGSPLTPVALERAVALATLTVAEIEEEAPGALAAEPYLAAAPNQLRPLAHWLRQLYPPATAEQAEGSPRTRGFARGVPTPLGEALIAAVLAEVAYPADPPARDAHPPRHIGP